ncbi:MAG: hypothetical protein VCG02_12420, partial [Verrucomicrobiota bacterium]
MKATPWISLATLVAGLLWGTVASAGPLDPTSPPAPTMKSLQEIWDRVEQLEAQLAAQQASNQVASLAAIEATEPRVPITSVPYTITQPGSYYLVSNLLSTTDGIIIQVSGVTVDLMGFSITGDNTGATDYGILLSGPGSIEDVVIKGGVITGFNDGLYGSMSNSRVENMRFSKASSDGVELRATNPGYCNGNTFSNCTISENG